jgi:hypothetical protein
MLWLWLLPVVVGSEGRFEVVERGIASMYRPWKKSATVPYARYAGRWNVLPKPTDRVCAHRWFPFKTKLRLTRRDGRSSTCVVLDRGPFGACVPTGDAVKRRGCPRGYRYRVIVNRRRLPRGAFYRGVIDATPLVHQAMGSPGWLWVKVERQRSRKGSRLASALNF